MNPCDWANIEIERGDDGQYLLGNPTMMAQPMLWGANVHATPALPAGTFIVMDTASAMLWCRQNATMLSDSQLHHEPAGGPDGSSFRVWRAAP